MLKNDYILAKIGFDTAENEPYVKSLAVVAIRDASKRTVARRSPSVSGRSSAETPLAEPLSACSILLAAALSEKLCRARVRSRLFGQGLAYHQRSLVVRSVWDPICRFWKHICSFSPSFSPGKADSILAK